MPAYAQIQLLRRLPLDGTMTEPGPIIDLRGDAHAIRHLRKHLGWSACRIVDLPGPPSVTTPADGVELRARLAAAEAEAMAQRDEALLAAQALAAQPQALVPAELALARAILDASDELLISAPAIGPKKVDAFRAWAQALAEQHPVIETPAADAPPADDAPPPASQRL